MIEYLLFIHDYIHVKGDSKIFLSNAYVMNENLISFDYQLWVFESQHKYGEFSWITFWYNAYKNKLKVKDSFQLIYV